jgi:glucokinase
MTEAQPPIVAVDIGGTHARFAIARSHAGGIALGGIVTLQTRDFADFRSAWNQFSEIHGRMLPRRAAIAVAGPVDGETIRFTNNAWTIRANTLAGDLGLENALVLNDLEAAAHAAMHCGEKHFQAIGPCGSTPTRCGITSVVGPGTGLGVAYIRREGSEWTVHPTEGGHAGFAPVDEFEEALLRRLRNRFHRVSIERVASGPAIVDLYNALADKEGRPPTEADDRTIWRRALVDEEPHSLAAVERFCQALGSVVGDIALTHGADSVVIAGGLGLRLAAYLPASGFLDRFRAKGRFADHMVRIPLRLLIHPQPGLLGAAAAGA